MFLLRYYPLKRVSMKGMHTHLSIYFFFSTLSSSRVLSNFDIFSAVGSKDGISIVHALSPSTVLHTIFCYLICPIDRSIKRKICCHKGNFSCFKKCPNSHDSWFCFLFHFQPRFFLLDFQSIQYTLLTPFIISLSIEFSFVAIL